MIHKLICWVLITATCAAGTLHRFEKDASKKEEKNSTSSSNSTSNTNSNHNSSRTRNCHNDDDEQKEEGVFEHILERWSGILVVKRQKPCLTVAPRASTVSPRPIPEMEGIDWSHAQTGPPILRCDLSYQDESAKLYSHNSRIEAGHGCFGLRLNNAHYIERDPSDHMNVFRWHVLYRDSPRNLRNRLGCRPGSLERKPIYRNALLVIPVRSFSPP